MKIEFSKLNDTVLDEFHGGEKAFISKMFLDDNNKILLGKLEKGASIGMHEHLDSSEIIFIVSGKAKAICGVEEELSSGECHYCPKGMSHSLVNIGDSDLVFFAVVPKQ